MKIGSVTFLLVLVLLTLVGCRTVKPTKETVRTVKDSTITEVTYQKRDTTIIIPGDTLKVRVPFTEITKEPFIKKSGRSTAIITRKGDSIDVECITEELLQRFEIVDKMIKELRLIQESEKQRIEIPVRYIPWWIEILAWIGGAALIGLGIVLALKLKFI
tara:strand:- start:417 stop:896 length:480 start_codon:yes stop_codon:yes gene_type:complete